MIEEIAKTEEIEQGNEPIENEGSEEKPELEPWQMDDGPHTVPLGAHVNTKRKLKGKISRRDDEISELKQRLSRYEERTHQPPKETISKRPISGDFDTDEDYREAVTAWEERSIESKVSRVQQEKEFHEAQRRFSEALNTDVNAHYERAANLVNKHAIDTEVYQKTDLNVRSAIENVFPGKGDVFVDALISNLGEGSEKTMYMIGRNKEKLNAMTAAAAADPSGVKLSIFLGQQHAHANMKTTLKSQAPSPAPNIGDGERSETVNEASLKKQFLKHHDKGNAAQAYSIRKMAREAGVDVSGWGA